MAYLLNTSTTFLCLLFQWIIVFSIGAQESISTQLSNYTTTHATEKIFIHHDRAYYAQGDDIWYKVYLVDATHHFPINDGRLTDVELIDPSGNIISQQTLKMDTVNNHGQIAIGTNWKPGRYTLRAYTKYFDKTRSHNIFTKTLSIYAAEKLESTASGDISKKGKISIYPEGGDLISDVLQTVAIEFSGDTKRYAQGKVIDNRNQEITTFKLQQNGIGYFKLTTDPNKNYSVILTDGREEIKESIPVALKEGYVMSIENRHHDFFTLILEASPTLDLRDAFILIHLRGKEILKIDKLQNKEYPIKVSKENFKSGVFHITLFDKDSRPQCERLIFINKKDQELNAAVELSSQTYSRREEAQVMIDVDDQDGNAIHSNLSVAVVDNKLFPLDPLQSNISSHLLLESELGGPIDIAPLYLDEGADKSFLIDILMMTKGWRRFNWKDVLETDKPLVTSTSDKGFRISGVVSKKYRARKRVKSNVFLTVHGSQFEMHETLTDDDGRFTFTDVNIPDSTVLTIQANAYNEKKDLQDETQSGPNGNRSVDIHMDDSESLPVVLHSDKDKQVEVTDYKELVNLVTRKNDVLRVQSEGFSLNIEEVTIKGKRQSFYEKHDIERPLYHGVEYRIIPDSLAALNETATVFDLIRRKVSGANISGTPRINQTVQFRFNGSFKARGSALFLVNGNVSTIAFVNSLDASQIKAIEVIKNGANSPVYSSRSFRKSASSRNGIVSIFLKKDAWVKKKTLDGLINIEHPGYHQAREFYMPDYSVNPNNSGLPDIRPTLYWNPNIDVDDSTAAFNFYTSDKATTYNIVIQGISNDGRPIYQTKLFKVE